MKNNLRLNLMVFYVLILIFIFNIPYSVLAQENGSKIIAQEGGISTFQNGNFSELPQKNDFLNNIIIAFFGVFVGWLLGIFQPIIIEPIKRKLDKKRLKKILPRDIKNLMEQLKNKRESILKSSNKTTIEEAIESITRNPTKDILKILVPIKLCTDIYIMNYGTILENFDDKNLIEFYLNIQDLNSILNVMERTDPDSPKYLLLLISYYIEIEKCLSKGKKISI